MRSHNVRNTKKKGFSSLDITSQLYARLLRTNWMELIEHCDRFDTTYVNSVRFNETYKLTQTRLMLFKKPHLQLAHLAKVLCGCQINNLNKTGSSNVGS